MGVTIPRGGHEFGTGAARRYVEEVGSALVTSAHLRIALAAVSAVVIALAYLNFRTNQALRAVRPVVIRIDDVGRAAAVTGAAAEYVPQAPELKYFLVRFVTDHYSRLRATAREGFARSLYFLDGRLADATIEANRRSKTIERFLADPREEIDVRVRNVTLEDLRQPPYRATVDYQKIYYAPADHTELRRESFIGQFVFVVRDPVPNAIVPVNPLGLTITYFREDQAFVDEGARTR